MTARLLSPALLGRHQVAAFAATTVDFGVMIAAVELMRVPPAAATLIGAVTGGVANFLLSRRWAFARRHDGSVASQAARYAAVSAGGALLNAALMALALHLVAAPYPLARVVVSVVVSLLYTYPLHMRVVFRVQA